ncbi:MAG: hypothetical protein HY925_16640, partial [Elusimicrobia bacterium]|nr:hypothetical protein [Elusimicrobiota bacterium]
MADTRVWATEPSSITPPAERRLPDDLTKDQRYIDALAALTKTTPDTRRFDARITSENQAENEAGLAKLRLDDETLRTEFTPVRAGLAAWFLDAKPGRAEPPDRLAAVEQKFLARPILPSDAAARAPRFSGLGPAAANRLRQADQHVRALGEDLATARWAQAEIAALVAAMGTRPGLAPNSAPEGVKWRDRLKALAARIGAEKPEEAIRFYLNALGFGQVTETDVAAKYRTDGRLTDAEVAQLADIAKKGKSDSQITADVDAFLQGIRAQPGRQNAPEPSGVVADFRRIGQGPQVTVSAPRTAGLQPAAAATTEPERGLRITAPPMTVTRATQEANSAPTFSLTPVQGVELAAGVAQGRQAAYLVERKNRLVKRAQAIQGVLRSENAEARQSFDDQLAAIYAGAGETDFEERMKAWLDTADRYIHSRFTSPDGALEEQLLQDEKVRRVDASLAVSQALGADSALMDAFSKLSSNDINALAQKARSGGGMTDREQRLWNALNGYWQAMGEDKLRAFYAARPARKALLDLENQDRAFQSDALAAGDVPSGTRLAVDEIDRQRLAERLGVYQVLDPKATAVTASQIKPRRVGGTDATDESYTGVTVDTEDGRQTFVSNDRRLHQTTVKIGESTAYVRRFLDAQGGLLAVEQSDPADPRSGIRQEGTFDDQGALKDGLETRASAGAVMETSIAAGKRALTYTRDADGDVSGAVRYENGRPAAVWDRATGRTSYYEYVGSTTDRPFRVGGQDVELTVIRRGAPDGPIAEAYYEPPNAGADFGRRVEEVAGHALHAEPAMSAMQAFNSATADANADPAKQQQAFDALVAALKQGELTDAQKAALTSLAARFKNNQGTRYNFLRNGELSAAAVEAIDFSQAGSGADRRDVVSVTRPDEEGFWDHRAGAESRSDDRREVRQTMERGANGSEVRSYFRYANAKLNGQDIRVQVRTETADEGSKVLGASAVLGDTEFRWDAGAAFPANGDAPKPSEKVVREANGTVTMYKAGARGWWQRDPEWHPVQKIEPNRNGRTITQWEDNGDVMKQTTDPQERPLWTLFLTRGGGTYRNQQVNAVGYRYENGTVRETYYKEPAGGRQPPGSKPIGGVLRTFERGRIKTEANLNGDGTEVDRTTFLQGSVYLKINLAKDDSNKQWLAEAGEFEYAADGKTATLKPRTRYKANGAWNEEALAALPSSHGVDPAKKELNNPPSWLVSTSRALGEFTQISEGQRGNTVTLNLPSEAQFRAQGRDRSAVLRGQSLDKIVDELSSSLPASGRPGEMTRTQAKTMLTQMIVSMRDSGRMDGNVSLSMGPSETTGAWEPKHTINFANLDNSGSGILISGNFENGLGNTFGMGNPRWALVTKVAVPMANGRPSPTAQWQADNVIQTSIITGTQDTKEGKTVERASVLRNEYVFGDNGQGARLVFTNADREGVVMHGRRTSLALQRFQLADGGTLSAVGSARSLGSWDGRIVDEEGRDRLTGLGGALDAVGNNKAAHLLVQEPMDLVGKGVTGIFAIANKSAEGWRRIFGDNEGAGINEVHALSEGWRAIAKLSSDPAKRDRQIARMGSERVNGRNKHLDGLSREADGYIVDMANMYRESSLNAGGGNLWMTPAERQRLLAKPVSDAEKIATIGDVGFGNYGKMAAAGAFGEGAKPWSSWIGAGEEFLKGLPLMVIGGGITKGLASAASVRGASTLIKVANGLNKAYNIGQMGLMGTTATSGVLRTVDMMNAGMEWQNNIAQNLVDIGFVAHSAYNYAAGRRAAREGKVVETNAEIERFRDMQRPGEPPRVEAPRVEAPKVEAPRVEAPRVEAPPAEAPRAPPTAGEQPVRPAAPPTVERAPLNVKAPELNGGGALKNLGGNLSSPAAGELPASGGSAPRAEGTGARGGNGNAPAGVPNNPAGMPA